MYCQCIEFDIKNIYAGMAHGDFENNYNTIKDYTLGQIINELKLLDNSDGNPYFNDDDYKVLNQIKIIRNHLAHQCFLDFIYSDNKTYNEDLNRKYNRVLNDHNRLKKLSDLTEKIRFDILNKFGRV